MKKLILSALLACFGLGFAAAQEPGNAAIGPRLGFYSHTGHQGEVLGVGATGRYALSKHWRAEGNLLALCVKGASIDVNANMQYLFKLAPIWSLYPMAGISANDLGKWSCGINLGAGTDFTLARHWDLTADVRWIIQTAKGMKDPFVISIGAAYKF